MTLDRFRKLLRALAPSIFFLCLSLFSYLPKEDLARAEEEAKEGLTIEELNQTEARSLFASGRFARALEEFRKLEREYPKEVAIKRYLGACLDHLGREEEAIRVFQQALQINSGDLPSRYFLGKIYLKRAELEKAEGEFTSLLSQDPKGALGSRARTQLEIIRRLGQAAPQAAGVPGRTVPPQEFIRTKAAKFFMNARYEEALREFEALEKQYPEDVLVKRYKALTLDKLKRFDEALAILESASAAQPGNMSLRYFLAQVLIHKKDFGAATRVLEEVVARDETGVYRARARAELEQTRKGTALVKGAKRKRWRLNGSLGVERDSNPASSPRLAAFRSTPIYSAWRFLDSLGGSYELFKKRAWSGKANYNYSETFYSDSFSNLNTLSNTFGATVAHVRMLKGKPLIVQFGQSMTHTLLLKKFYSAAFSDSLTLIYSPRDWFRMTLSERWNYSAYDSDGSAPDSTSRDGFGNTVSLNNYFYFNQEKSFYSLLGFEHALGRTQGVNYRKNAFSGRTGLHFPLFFNWEGDVSFKFKDTRFPKYGFPTTTPGRRDEEFILEASLSRTFLGHWSISIDYSYTNDASRDDNFTYTNHAVGSSTSFSF